MPHTSSRPESDRNLLFGILAVQLHFISRDDLDLGMSKWALEKYKSLGQILIEQGRLSAEQVQTLDALMVQQLKAHGDDPSRGLQAVKTVTTAVASLLTNISDAGLQASTVHVSKDDSTASFPHEAAAAAGAVRGAERYRRLRPHASGGLGEVFVAEDTELHREVALKQIKAKYADDERSRLRFLREAEITGGLQHPGIVPVYGLGAYPDGRPFYAMRFIRGNSLREAIERFHGSEKSGRDASEQSLSLHQLLHRFVAVCNAVAYAHSRGVLHRDLKPANVMLGEFGETLVVDWGLAKAGVESGLAPESLSAEPALRPTSVDALLATHAGALVGTIAYMSPEQAAGQLESLGPASDIYGLGAILYVLLAGKGPFFGKEETEALAAIKLGYFAPPRAVKAGTPPALDAICRKAMALDPKDRYASALDLADDVEHWLADEPVAAYPEPWTMRVGRMARRHRTKLVAAAVLLLTAVAALSVSTALVVAEQQETEKQRQAAVKNYEISRKQSFDIISLIESSESEFASVPALHDRRHELLTTASNACRQFLLQKPDDVELQKRAAQIYRFAANFKRLINETTEAERLYQDALALREKLSADSAEDKLLLADTVRDHGGLQIKLGRLREATGSFEKALKMTDEDKADEKKSHYRRRTALALRNLASIDYRKGMHQKSGVPADNIQRAVDLFRSLVEGPAEERNPYDPLLLAGAVNLSAMMDRHLDRLDDAQKKHAQAIQLLKGMLDGKPKMVNEADVVLFMSECQIEQCKSWAKVAKPKFLAAAETNLGVAINKLAGLVRDYPKIPAYQEALAEAYRERGEVRLQAQNFQGAREHFQSAQKLLAPLVQKYPELPSLHSELGRTLLGLGKAARALKDDQRHPWFEQAAAELKSALARSPEDAQLQAVLDELAELRK
ncbi:MAG: protein kinase [Gemmataceae bacterium]|nr:protein kinase [Gemmataceae bacterium]MCI0739180.1 protein kinase [Gemmataceae bacterium]